MADTVNAVDRSCVDVECTERELVQLRSRSGDLVFHAGGLPHRPLPPSLFPSKYPLPFAQFQAFSTQVLAFVFPMCLVKHSQHTSTSPSSTILLTRVCPPSISTLLALGPTFSAAAVYQRLPLETLSLCWDGSPPVNAVSLLALSASTSSHIKRRHVGTSIHARIL